MARAVDEPALSDSLRKAALKSLYLNPPRAAESIDGGFLPAHS